MSKVPGVCFRQRGCDAVTGESRDTSLALGPHPHHGGGGGGRSIPQGKRGPHPTWRNRMLKSHQREHRGTKGALSDGLREPRSQASLRGQPVSPSPRAHVIGRGER